MRLRKLLLGSAAVLFAGGMASAPALAADPIATPVGVTPMATMQDYLLGCEDNTGIQFTDWCFVFSGQVELEAKFGYEIDYDVTPGGNTLEGPFYLLPFEEFAEMFQLCLTATRELDTGAEIEVRFPSFEGFDSCGNGWPRLQIRSASGLEITFEEDEVAFEWPASFGTVTLALLESDVTGGFWPDVELTLEFATGNIDWELWGRVGWQDYGFDPAASLEMAIDPGNFGLTLFGKIGYDDFGAGKELDLEADATLAVEVGPAELEFGAHFDHVEVAAVRAAAWGVNAEASIGFGMTTLTAGVLFGVNDDFGAPGDLTQPYDFLAVGDRAILAFAGVEMEWNDMHTTELLVTYSNIFTQAGYAAMEVNLQHHFLPWADDDILEFTGEVWWQTDFGAGVGNAFGGALGVTVPIH
jgi:hypothetical protein